jgi:hypothetical protein
MSGISLALQCICTTLSHPEYVLIRLNSPFQQGSITLDRHRFDLDTFIMHYTLRRSRTSPLFDPRYFSVSSYKTSRSHSSLSLHVLHNFLSNDIERFQVFLRAR